MGRNRALRSDSSVVGRLHDARASQLDIFRAARDPAAGDQYLHGRRARFAGHQRRGLRRSSGALFRAPKLVFGALLASVVFSLSKSLALRGHLPNRFDTAFQFTFCVAAIFAAVIRSECSASCWLPHLVYCSLST